MLTSIVVAIGLTALLALAPNRSNISSLFAIPFLVVFLTKYLCGDWDAGYAWTSWDLAFWIVVPGVSLGTLYLLGVK
jgi:hypothetical protein